MAFLHANVFASKFGLPLRTVKRLCLNGKLPHLRSGRTYLLEENTAASALMSLQKAQCPIASASATVRPILNKKENNFLAEIKNLRKTEKEELNYGKS